MKEILDTVKRLNKETKILLDISTKLYGSPEINLITKEYFTNIPIQEGDLDWSKSFELGNNILGIRIPSENSVRFILRAIDDGEYNDHFHNCLEIAKVLNPKGELIFIIDNKKIIVDSSNPKIKIDKEVVHKVLVKKETLFQVDFI